MYWIKGIGQGLASVVRYVQVGTRRTVRGMEVGGDDTSGTPSIKYKKDRKKRSTILDLYFIIGFLSDSIFYR